MTAKEIIEICIKELQDSSFSRLDLLGHINACCGQLASVYDIPSLLFTKDVVVIGAETPAPDDFLRSIFHAANFNTGRRVKVENEFSTFLGRFPLLDRTGDVTDVSWFGSTFFFQGIPSSPQTIRIRYYGSPKQIVETGSPTFIPRHLHQDLFVNYVLGEAFNSIEDGIDGTKVNSNKYTSRFQLACLKLESFLGTATQFPQFVPENEHEEDELEGI